MPNPVHDIPRHPKSGAYASGKVEFRAITMRDDNGETIITSGISVAKFTADGEGFTIDLPEGLLESRVRITGGTITEWENGRFVNPPGGGRYLTLLQSFTGVPDDPSALEALYAVLAETFAPLPEGTPTGAKFLRDDNTWAAPPSGGGGGSGSLTDDGTGLFTFSGGSLLTEDGSTGLFTIGA